MLAPAALACGHCHALVHAAELEQLAVSARRHEERSEITEARNDWLRALELLPPDSAQAEWIRNNTKRLEATATPAAAGAVYRLFTKDIPVEPSRAATAYYIALLAALGYLTKLAPMPLSAGHG